MKARCPESQPLALAHLPHPWIWLINARGYANVVNTSCSSTSESSNEASTSTKTTDVLSNTHQDAVPDGSTEPGVFGVLYHLPPADEALLDVYEGVPFSYQKLVLPVTVVPGTTDQALASSAPEDQVSGTVEALVYVDQKRTGPGDPREEYVARINRGIHEASEQFALPAWYVNKVLRPFIPEGEWKDAGISAHTES